jgi:hypothetical protein
MRSAATIFARAGVAGCVLACALVAGCAAGNRARRADAELVVVVAVAEARVYVDDTFAGRAGDLRGRALAVPSGNRRVEVRADGYFTAYRDVVIAPRARATVDVRLHAAPPNEPAE